MNAVDNELAAKLFNALRSACTSEPCVMVQDFQNGAMSVKIDANVDLAVAVRFFMDALPGDTPERKAGYAAGIRAAAMYHRNALNQIEAASTFNDPAVEVALSTLMERHRTFEMEIANLASNPFWRVSEVLK